MTCTLAATAPVPPNSRKGKSPCLFEWEELHLTPEGWKEGRYRHEPGAAVVVAPPPNEVLTVRRHVAAVYGGPSRVTEDRTPRTDDMNQIEQLLLKYGAPVFGV